MKTEYDTEVEYLEDDQNVYLPFIHLVMTLNLECSSSLVQSGCYGNCFDKKYRPQTLIISTVMMRSKS